MARPLALLLCILFLLALVSCEIAYNGVGEELKKGAQNRKGSNGQGNLRPSQCSGECGRRCSRTQYKKPCLFFCNKCCAKCLCVPPGYYGNKQSCSCYNDWKTKRGGPKCP